jgi:hypothetical protein
MPNLATKPTMRLIPILLLCFTYAHAQPRVNTIHVPAIGWRITVPPGYVIEDSTIYYQQLRKLHGNSTRPGQADKVLLYIHDSTGWNLSKYSLEATLRYMPDSATFLQYISKRKEDLTAAFTTPSLPQRLRDTLFTTRVIGERLFHVDHYQLRRGQGEIIDVIIEYYAYTKGQLFKADIHYMDSDERGKALVTAFESSVFNLAR